MYNTSTFDCCVFGDGGVERLDEYYVVGVHVHVCSLVSGDCSVHVLALSMCHHRM